MQLVVKPGREYVLGGKVYKAGETVDAPDKFAPILTAPRGPLEHPTVRRQATDLPPAVMAQAAPVPEPSPETPAASDETETESPTGRRRYRRRDLQTEE